MFQIARLRRNRYFDYVKQLVQPSVLIAGAIKVSTKVSHCHSTEVVAIAAQFKKENLYERKTVEFNGVNNSEIKKGSSHHSWRSRVHFTLNPALPACSISCFSRKLKRLQRISFYALVTWARSLNHVGEL